MSLADLYPDWTAATEEAMHDPQPGDCFSEMYSYWMYVVDRRGDQVVTMEGNPPCTFPTKNVKTRNYATVEEYRSRFAYKSIPGYWVRLHSRGHNVTGWLP